MVPANFGRLLCGMVAAAIILAGCQGRSLSGLPASPEEAVMAMKIKLDLSTRARRAAEYHVSRRDWRSARIAVTEAKFAEAEAEEIRAAAAESLRVARHAHRRAKDELSAANREVERLPGQGRNEVVSAADGAPIGRLDANGAETARSVNGASARAHIAWAAVVAMAREEGRSENALIEIDRLLSDIRMEADQTRRVGRSGRLTRSSPSIPVPDTQ